MDRLHRAPPVADRDVEKEIALQEVSLYHSVALDHLTSLNTEAEQLRAGIDASIQNDVDLLTERFLFCLASEGAAGWLVCLSDHLRQRHAPKRIDDLIRRLIGHIDEHLRGDIDGISFPLALSALAYALRIVWLQGSATSHIDTTFISNWMNQCGLCSPHINQLFMWVCVEVTCCGIGLPNRTFEQILCAFPPSSGAQSLQAGQYSICHAIVKLVGVSAKMQLSFACKHVAPLRWLSQWWSASGKEVSQFVKGTFQLTVAHLLSETVNVQTEFDLNELFIDCVRSLQDCSTASLSLMKMIIEGSSFNLSNAAICEEDIACKLLACCRTHPIAGEDEIEVHSTIRLRYAVRCLYLLLRRSEDSRLTDSLVKNGALSILAAVRHVKESCYSAMVPSKRMWDEVEYMLERLRSKVMSTLGEFCFALGVPSIRSDETAVNGGFISVVEELIQRNPPCKIYDAESVQDLQEAFAGMGFSASCAASLASAFADRQTYLQIRVQPCGLQEFAIGVVRRAVSPSNFSDKIPALFEPCFGEHSRQQQVRRENGQMVTVSFREYVPEEEWDAVVKEAVESIGGVEHCESMWFHGTAAKNAGGICEQGIDVDRQTHNKDFGGAKGTWSSFYVTDDLAYASGDASRAGGSCRAILLFGYDSGDLPEASIRFENDGVAWRAFVTLSHLGRNSIPRLKKCFKQANDRLAAVLGPISSAVSQPTKEAAKRWAEELQSSFLFDARQMAVKKPLVEDFDKTLEHIIIFYPQSDSGPQFADDTDSIVGDLLGLSSTA